MIALDVYNVTNSNTTDVFLQTYRAERLRISRSGVGHGGAAVQDQRAVRLLRRKDRPKTCVIAGLRLAVPAAIRNRRIVAGIPPPSPRRHEIELLTPRMRQDRAWPVGPARRRPYPTTVFAHTTHYTTSLCEIMFA